MFVDNSCSLLATTRQQSIGLNVSWPTPAITSGGLLLQVQQVCEETTSDRVRKHAPQAEKDNDLVFHMPEVPLPPWWQHRLECLTH